ncbi:MAG: hypothetical protein H0U10_10110 [Chloroflexia bacterium]|nr:hypothetical protein [Chloroflexia bacterium]
MLLAAGADALLIGFEAAADPSVAHAAISRLRSDPSEPLRVIVEHSPALAASVGAGVLLAERGVSTAEARRILGPGRLLGRVVGSPISAAAAAGADVLVVEGPPSEPASLRAIVEAAWAPVLASSQPTVPALVNLLPQFVRAGAEGIILRCEPVATPLMLVPLVSAARALLPPAWFDAGPTSKASAVVVVDGVAHPLPPETAVTDLLADLGRSNATAVALNGVTVARRRWDDTLLAADDDLRVIGI